MIPLFYPSYDGKAIRKELKKLFPRNMSNRWLGQGDKVMEFENLFAKTFAYDYVLGLNSGSAALELAYHLIGIKRGDVVMTPVLTCTATNIPLLRLGAKIVFIDITKERMTMDAQDLEKKILEVGADKVKCIVTVTLGGMFVGNKVYDVAKKYKIPVIVDAAQSLGVRESKGDFICYSLQAIKHFTSGDGGVLVSKSPTDHYRAKKLRWFGIDREAKIANDWQPYKKREMTMNIEEPGYKFHMNDIAATIAITGLKHNWEWYDYRKKIADYYLHNIKCPVIVGGAYWLAGIQVENRDKVAEYLKSKGIETNMAHLRNDIFTAFGGERLDLPNMNAIEEKYLYIPLNLKVSMRDAAYIAKCVNEATK